MSDPQQTCATRQKKPKPQSNSAEVPKTVSASSASSPTDHSYCRKSHEQEVKFLSLIVNGLRSKLKYGILDSYIMSFDIICLSETKLDCIDPNWFVGYTAIPLENKSKNFPRGGVHGVCVLIKSIYCKYAVTISGMCSAHVQWIYVKKRPLGKVSC